MDDSYNYNSFNKKDNSLDMDANTDLNYYYKNRDKTNSFFDYQNPINNNEINDFLGNSDIKYNFDNNDNYYVKENDDNDNDISSEDEYELKLNNIKLDILKIKLTILVKIICSKIQKDFFHFISKIKLKIKSNEIFLQGDNFLYSKLKSKTSDVNKYYAFKKIIYVLRKHKYEILIKENYFNQWKLKIKNKYIINKKQKLNSINIVKFCSILVKIINRRLENKYKRKYYLNKWDMLKNYNDIKNNNIIKGMLILSNLFNRKIRIIFKKFHRNYLNIKMKSNIFKKVNNNKKLTLIIEDNDLYYYEGLRDFYDIKQNYDFLLKQNKLLKIIERLDIKNRVNKNIFVFFNLLKNSTTINQNKKDQITKLSSILNDLKYDSMLNAATMIKIIINEYIYNDIYIYKKYFLRQLYHYHKFYTLYNQYKKNYRVITKKIDDEEGKQQIRFIRNIYKRIFALQKILIINNRHRFIYSDLNFQLKNQILQKYFYIWRNIIFDMSFDKYIKRLSTHKLFLMLYDIFYNKIKRRAFYFIKKRAIHQSFIKQKYYYFSYYMYLFLKRYILLYVRKKIFYKIKNIGNYNSEEIKDMRIIIYFKSKKLFLIYKRHIKLKMYKYLIQWKFISSSINHKKRAFKDKMKPLLIHLNKINNNQLISRIFSKWARNKFIGNKLNYIYKYNQLKELKKNFYLHKFISTKYLMSMWFHFKKWQNTESNIMSILNYESLLIELDQLRKENDDLIPIYYKKRQEYAKSLYDYNYMKKYYCSNCINEHEEEIDYMSLKSNDIREAGKMTNSLLISQNKIDISKDNSKYNKNRSNEDKNEKDDNNRFKASYRLSSDGNNNFIVNEENKLQTSNSDMMSLSEDEDMNSHIGKKIPQCTGETIFSKNLFMDDNASKTSNNNITNTNNYKSKNMDNNDEEEINRRESIINEYQKEYEEQQKYYENYIKILLEKKNELIQMKNLLKKQKNESE